MKEQTIKTEVYALTEVMKSKFTAFAFPVNDIDSFKIRLEQIRKANPKARHVCYAYRIGQNSKSNDDGEPKGTAGRPLLELLTKRNLNNIGVIVVRYYGGVQLGAGRLLRTYVSSANNALNLAEFMDL